MHSMGRLWSLLDQFISGYSHWSKRDDNPVLDLLHVVLEAELPDNLGTTIFVTENLYKWCGFSLAIQSCVI